MNSAIKPLICMFLDQDFPPDIRVEKEIKTLQENGFKVLLVVISYNRKNAHDIIDGIEIYRIFGDRLMYKLSALAFTFPVFHSMIYNKIKKFIKYFKPDFLHVHDMVIAPSVLKASLKFNIPLILDLHENRPAIMELYAHTNRFPGKYLINLNNWKKAQRMLQEKVSKLIVVTEEAKEYAVNNEEINKNKIYVVPNTVKRDFKQNLTDSEVVEKKFKNMFCILYFGDTSLRRGTDNIIEAISILKNKITNIQAIFVGKGSEDDKLNSLAKKLKVLNHVSFEGWQDVKYLKAYANASAIGICPFKRNLHHDTTFANKLFQFMGLGLPLLVSDCPSQVNIVKRYNCGIVHKANDPKDIADKILDLFNDPKLRNDFAKNGEKAIFNDLYWEKTSKPLIDLYNSFKN